MSNKEVKICRLCFNFVIGELFDPIDYSLKMMLGIIAPGLKFDVTKEPVMCKECSNCVQKAFDFKTNFFEVEEIIESKKTAASEDCQTLNYLLSNNRSNKYSKINHCRTCLMKIEGQLCLDAKVIDHAQENVFSILENCLFEMDFSLTSDCKICLPCFDKLQEMYKFKTNCIKNEQKIDTYIKENSVEPNIKISLHSIASAPIKQEIDVHSIKVEPADEQMTLNIKVGRGDREMCVQNEIAADVDIITHKIKVESGAEDPFQNMVEHSVEGNSVRIKYIGVPIESNLSKSTTNKKQLPNVEDAENTQYKCPECSFNTKYKNNIKRHLTNVHHRTDVIKTRFYQCKECSYSSKKNIEMIKHCLTHANADEFMCSKCPYGDNRKSELIKHIFSHIDKDSLEKYKSATEEGLKIRKKQ